MSRFKAAEPGSTTSFVADSGYTYLADGRTEAKDDAVNDAFDQTNKYDFAGRLKFNQFGMGTATGGGTKRVYEQAITYDAFSNMTARDTTYWGDSNSFSRTYTNGRNSISAYDAAGNITNNGMGDNFQLNTFDAAGRRTGFVERVWLWEEHSARMNEFETDYVFDGDGRPVEERKGTRMVSVPTPPPMSVQVSKYQVWSSVLGASVATLLPDGTPLTRNVFAGKAVIAELRGTGAESYDMVNWKTSDPVSGTVVSYRNDGTTNTGFVSKQTEPLGQSIAGSDPAPPNEPQTYAQHLFFASDPEWQCEAAGLGAYGSLFKDLPEHCQRKALYAAGAYLPWEGEETTIVKISYPTNPIHEASHQLDPVQEMMQNTLSITDKFASSGGPSSGGDGGWYQSGDMQWDVQVNAGYDIIADNFTRLDASNPGGGEPQFAPPGYDLDVLLDTAEGIIKNAKDDCAKLLGPGALAKFQQLRKDGKIAYGSVQGADARTEGDSIKLDQDSYTFDPDYRLPVIPGSKYNTQEQSDNELKKFEKVVSKSGASSRYEFATAAVIHEFLHAIGKFGPDVTVNIFGERDIKKSLNNQKKVIEECFKK